MLEVKHMVFIEISIDTDIGQVKVKGRVKADLGTVRVSSTSSFLKWRLGWGISGSPA